MTDAAKVYLDYDQAGLDAAYDQAVFATNREQIQRRQLALSAAVRQRLGSPQRFAYGPTASEHLDVFSTGRPNAPVFAFLHGGAWRANSSERFGFLAETFVEAGAHFVLVDFAGVEEMNGDLRPIVDQVRRAIAWLAANAARFGADAERLHVGGHSSGAHLTSCVLLTDWAQYGVARDAVKGALCCSGMYDLYPVSLSARSSYVRFTPDVVAALGALRQPERITAPVIVAYGSEESPEFKRQNTVFAEALRAAGKPVRLVFCEGYNHFEIVESLGHPHGFLGAAVLDQMGLVAPALAR